MKKEDVEALGLVILWNIVVLACFTAVAVIFQKWWLILVSALFCKGFSYKTGGKSEKD